MSVLIIVICCVGLWTCLAVGNYLSSRMIKEINQQPGARKIPLFGISTPFTVVDIFEQHREFYPNSRLRVRFYTCLLLAIAFIAVGVFFVNIILAESSRH